MKFNYGRKKKRVEISIIIIISGFFFSFNIYFDNDINVCGYCEIRVNEWRIGKINVSPFCIFSGSNFASQDEKRRANDALGKKSRKRANGRRTCFEGTLFLVVHFHRYWLGFNKVINACALV